MPRLMQPLPPLDWENHQGGPVPALTGISAALVFLCALFMTGLNIVRLTSDHELLPVLALCAALGAGCCLLLRLRLPEKPVFFCLIGLGFLLRLSMILLVPTEPGQDFALFYGAAKSILSGDPGWTQNYYFVLYPNLIPICYYYAGLLSISDSILFCKLFNLLFMMGILVLVYAVSARLVNARAARVPTLLYALSPAVLLTATQLTNQHVSLFFMLLGAYLLIARPSLPASAAAGALIAAGNLFRSEGIVLYLSAGALLLLLLIDALRTRDKKRLLLRLANAACFFLAACAVSALLSAAFTRASGADIKNDTSYQWKLIVGLDDAEAGTYSDAHLTEFSAAMDGEAIIRRQLSDGRDWGDFFLRKMTAMWAFPEDPAYSFWNIDGNTRVRLWPLDTDVNGMLRRGLRFDCALYLLSLLLFAAAALRLLLSKALRTPGVTLLLLTFLANFAAYVLIEVAPRYRYFILPFLLILAAHALWDRAPFLRKPPEKASCDPAPSGESEKK